jgi:hypothetical protein
MSTEAERAAFLQARTQMLAYRAQKIKDLKDGTLKVNEKRLSDAEIADLLTPPQYRGSFHNTVVTYFDFPVWLFRFDEDLIYAKSGLQVDIRSYKIQRDKHINDVRELFGTFFLGKETGKALAKALENAGHELLILPYWNFSIYPKLPFTPMGLNATAQPVGTPSPGTRATDASIMFSAHMWPRDNNPGSTGLWGPGSYSDENLFHEMVHGVRQMMGISAEKNSTNDDYRNEEEFIAIVVTNIYMAEKKQKIMRH